MKNLFRGNTDILQFEIDVTEGEALILYTNFLDDGMKQPMLRYITNNYLCTGCQIDAYFNKLDSIRRSI